MAVLAQSGTILLEIPSSILADRWSRKYTLILASLLMGLSTAVYAAADSFAIVLLATSIWTINNALGSGTYEAYVYDLLKKLGRAKTYSRVKARSNLIAMLGVGVSAALSGPIAGAYGQRATFWLSIPFVLLTVAAMLSLPNIMYKHEQAATSTKHFFAAMQYFKKRWVVRSAIVLGFTYYYELVVDEFHQFFGIEIGLNVESFSLVLIIYVAGLALGDLAATRFGITPAKRRALFAVLLTCFGLMFFVRNPIGIAASVLLLAVFEYLQVQIEEVVQHEIPSAQRATSLSLLSASGQAMFFIAAFGFGYIYDNYSAYAAFLIVGAPLLLAALSEVVYPPRRIQKS